MQVADEVEKELESDDLLFEIGRGIRELACKFLDFVDDAVVCRPVRGLAYRKERADD